MARSRKNSSANTSTRSSAHLEDGDSQANELKANPTTEQTWAEIETGYRRINELINSLTPDDRGSLFIRFQKLAEEVASVWWAPLTAKTLAYFAERGVLMGIEAAKQTDEAVKQVKDHFTVKPRMTARDDEVVRLKDEEQLEWKEILKRIRTKPEWERGGRRKPVTMRALMTAYNRRKKSTQS